MGASEGTKQAAAELQAAADQDAVRVASEAERPDPARAAAYTAEVKAERTGAAERELAQDIRLQEQHRLPNDPIYRQARGDELEGQIQAAERRDPRDVPLPYGQDHLLNNTQINYLNKQKGDSEPPVAPVSPVEKLTGGKGGLDPEPGSGTP
jgi:hypothetical protein